MGNSGSSPVSPGDGSFPPSTAAGGPQAQACPAAPDLSTGAACPSPKVNAKGKKICCVCKETKSVRDECIVRNGEQKCRQFIEAHNQCLRAEGFDVQ